MFCKVLQQIIIFMFNETKYDSKFTQLIEKLENSYYKLQSMEDKKYESINDIKNGFDIYLQFVLEINNIFISNLKSLIEMLEEKQFEDVGTKIEELKNDVFILTIPKYYKNILSLTLDITKKLFDIYFKTLNDRLNYLSNTIDNDFLKTYTKYGEMYSAYSIFILNFIKNPHNYSEECYEYLIEKYHFSVLKYLELDKTFLKDNVKLNTSNLDFIDENPCGEYTPFSEQELEESEKYFLEQLYKAG